MTQSNGLFKWHKALSIIAIIWNLMGVAAYLMQAFMTDEAINLLPETERALYTNIPAWYTAAFAIAVFAGFFGSIFLLLKKKLATSLLMLSLIGIFVQMYYNFFRSKSMEIYGLGSTVMPVLVILIAIFLVWYARNLQTKGILA